MPNRIATGGQGRVARYIRTHKFITLLLVLYVAKGLIIATVHQPFSGHDEVMHYANLQFIADEHRPAVIPDLEQWREQEAAGNEMAFDKAPGTLWPFCQYVTPDWNIECWKIGAPTYKASLGDSYIPMGWVYTANHPPLYYLYLTPLYWLIDDQQLITQINIFRMATIPFGVITVLFAYLTARTLFPRDRFLAATVPTIVAFQPQVSYEAAMLNNDIAAVAAASALVYLIVRGLKSGFPVGNVSLIGFAFGLAILSKSTSLTMAVAIAVAMILGLGIRNWREWAAKGALAAGITGLLAAPWFIYMHRTYGDFTALDRIQTLQWWNYSGGTPPTFWGQLSDKEFLWMRWRETWGEFGWRLIPLGEPGNWWLLRTILWATLIGTVGIAVWAIRLYLTERRTSDTPAQNPDSVLTLERWQVVGVLTMGVTCITAYLAIIQFGVSFSLTQARYFFHAIVPAALLLMLGFRAIIPRKWLGYGQAAVFVSMVALTIYIYSAFVLPYWATAARLYEQIDPLYH